MPASPSRRAWHRILRVGAATLLTASSAVVTAAPAHAATPACGSGGTPTVTALADPTFYVDTGASPALLANYAGYTVRPSAALADAYVKLDTFTGGVISLASSQAAALPLGQLAANQAATEYFLLQASATTTVAQSHAITLYQGDPSLGGTAICTRSFTYNRVADTIKASANKVASVAASAASVKVGESITVTVNGTTGTLGAGPAYDPGVLAYTPAVYASFPASSWKLTRTQLTISPDGTKPQVTYTDRLYLNGASGGDRPYTAVYSFTALSPTASAVTITPVQQIASGTQVKHTDLTGLSVSFPSIASTASLTATKAASVAAQLGAGNVTYTVTVANSGGIGSIDRLVDVMPTGASLVAGSATLDGTTIPDPSVSGSTLVFPGPVTIPAAVGGVSGTKTYTYQRALPAAVGWYTNGAYATVGGSQIDTTASLLDDAKAAASVFVNAAPTAVNDTASTTQGTATDITVLTNDTLPALTTAGADPRVKSVTAVGTPTKGTVSINANNTLRYTPPASYTGTATFSYTMSDGKGGSASATVTVNMGPAAANDSYTLLAAVSTASSLAVVANDGCASCTITATSVASTTIATIAYSGTTITYTTKAAATITAGTTTDSFTYTITDPTTGYTSTATVSLAFSKAQRDLATTAVNTAVGISVAANDTCKSTGQKCGLTFPSSTSAGGGALSVTNPNTSSPTVTYTPPSSTWAGLDTFSYTVDVGTGANSSNQTVTGNTVLVGPGNQTSSVAPNTTTSASVVAAAFSANCTTCTYTLSGAAVTKGTLTLATDGTYTYSPNANTTGTDAFGFKVTDNSTGLNATATHTITITPVATNDTASTKENTAVTVAVLANDTCTSCTVAVTGAPAHGTTSVASNQITFTPTANYTGADSLTYRITDGASSQTTATLSLTVVGTPATPTPGGDTLTTAFNTAGSLDVAANDTNLQAGATFAKASNPAHGTATVSASGTASFTPTSGYTGTDSFTYQVCQPAPYDTTCATATVTVLVQPDAVADTLQAVAGQTLATSVASNDTAPVGATWAKASNPAHGTVTVTAAGTISYTPAAGYTGSDSFTYTICLAAPYTATCATATASVMVGPNATADTTTTTANVPVSIDVLANDGCATCEASLYVDAAHGAVSMNADGTMLYSPASGYTGTDTFTYLITDASGATASAAVTVTVSPTAANDSATTPTSTAVDIDYRANDACTSCTVSFTSPGHGTVSANGNGTAHYTPATSWTGTDSFTYTLTDPATSRTATATVTVVVNNAGPDSATTAYQTAVTLGTSVLANDTCAGCTVTAKTNPAHGTATVSASGTATYTPDTGFFGVDSFTYTATNGALTVTGTVTVLVGPPTRAENVTAATPFAGAALTGMTCTACTASSPSAPSHGTLALASDGTYTYTPDDGYDGVDTFTYTLTDATSGLTRTGTVNLTVTAPAAPSVTGESVTTAFNTAITDGDVTANDTGTGTLTWTKVTGTAHGTVSFTNGAFTYTPDAGYAGPDAFTYTVSDTYGQTSAAVTTSITVQPPDAPTAGADAYHTGLNLALSRNVAGNDTGTGALSFTRVANVAHGSLSFAANGSFTYTPAANYTGTDAFTYTIADTYGQTSNTATVSLTVDPPVTPVAADDTTSTAFETTLNGDVTANDTGTGTLTWAKASNPDHGTLTFRTDGSFTYTPDAGYAGPDAFTYTVADAYGQTSTAGTVTITVDPPAAPSATDDSHTTPFTIGFDADAGSNDTGTGALTWTLTTGVAHGTLAFPGDGTFSYDPAAGYAGEDSFTYSVADTYDQTSAPATVTVTVGPPTAPTAGNDTRTTAFATTIPDGDVTANDAGTGTLTWALDTPASHGTAAVASDGSYTYTPDATYAGPDAFTYTVSDAYGQSDTATVTITVAKPAAPTATDDARTTAYQRSITNGDTAGNDTGTGALTWTLESGPDHGTLTFHADGSFEYQPPLGYSGTTSFTYSVSDPYAQTSDPATVTITVDPPGAPVAVDDAVSTAFETTITGGDVTANDTGVDPLTYTLASDVAHGTLVFHADGSFTYTPDAAYVGTDSFTYTVADTFERTSTAATVTITVALPATPNVTGAGYVTPFNIGFDGDLTANASGTGPLTWHLASDVTHGTLSFTNGTFSYDPTPGFTGTDSFTVSVTDRYDQDSNTATVTITVGMPAAPTAIDDTAATPFATAILDGDTTGNDTGTGTLTWTLGTDASHGTLSFAADGSFTYLPGATFAGTDTFTYTVSDAYDQSSAPATVTITVANPPVPVATDDSFTVGYGNLLANTTRTNDTGTGALTSTLATGPAHGSVSLAANGTFSYEPDLGFAGPDTFTYTVGDAYGQSSAPATVTITVHTPAAPTAGDDTFTTPYATRLDDHVASNDTGTGTLTYQRTADVAHGTLTFAANGSFRYVPAATFVGADSFTYTVTDAWDQTSAPATVTITVEPDGATVTITGQLWFDRNHNGVRDADEPWLPGATVATARTGAASSLGVPRLGALVRPATSHLALAIGATTTTTDREGRYTFRTLPVGRYRITASASASGLEPGWDPDGATDWVSEIDAPGGLITVDMATSGQGAVTGQVRTTDGSVIANADVACTWAGIDGVLPSDDDVVFATTADAAGRFSVAEIPFGEFSCRGTDPASGEAASVAVTVAGRAVARVDIPLPVTGRRAGPGALATTGGGLTLAWLGAGALIAGASALTTARRRRG